MLTRQPATTLEQRQERARLLSRARQKRYLRRLRDGITIVSIQVDAKLLNTLLRLGYLHERDAHDSIAIARAVEAMHRSIDT